MSPEDVRRWVYSALLIGLWISVFSLFYFLNCKLLKGKEPPPGAPGVDGLFFVTTIITFLIAVFAVKIFGK